MFDKEVIFSSLVIITVKFAFICGSSKHGKADLASMAASILTARYLSIRTDGAGDDDVTYLQRLIRANRHVRESCVCRLSCERNREFSFHGRLIKTGKSFPGICRLELSCSDVPKH